MVNLFTIGFSKKDAETFFALLTKNNVETLIDIRLNNVSQLAGFANVKHLPYFLKLHNIKYIHKTEYAPTKELLDGYKKKSISWYEYEREYPKILDRRKIIEKIDIESFNNSVFLCSESTADKCHRRLLVEYIAKYFKDIRIKHL